MLLHARVRIDADAVGRDGVHDATAETFLVGVLAFVDDAGAAT
jgi:hypothetical protein